MNARELLMALAVTCLVVGTCTQQAFSQEGGLPKLHPPVAPQTTSIPIVYEGTLSYGVTEYGQVPYMSYTDPALWDYWRFYGGAGQVVTITLNRTDNAMDPLCQLYLGQGGDTDGLDVGWNGGGGTPQLTFLTYDDDGGSDIPPGPWYNSLISNYVLPATGWYTVTAADFAGNSPGPQSYALTVVPEPATLCLLAFGGLGVLIRRRRRG